MAEPGVATRAIRRARQRGASPLVIKALLEAGITESNLQHAKYSRVGTGDRDSVGFLQQRPSQGWGPAGESVEKDTDDFLDRALPLLQKGFKGSAGQLAQAVQRSAFPGRYDQHSAEADALLRMKGDAGTGQAARAGSGSTTARIPGQTFQTTLPTVDKAAFEQAQRRSMVGQLIARRNPNSFLLRSGLLTTNAPSLQDFVGSRTVKDVIPGTTVRIPKVSGGGSSLGSTGGGGSGAQGRIAITGPNPGRIQPQVRNFMGQIAAVAGEKVVGSDGTGHSKYTVNGNVSEHFTGSASDIPAAGPHLTRLGRAALIAAGMSPAQARKVKGGLFNLYRNGKRYQIIFQTNEGGNHYDHLHVGVSKR